MDTLVIFIRTLILYTVVIFGMRIMGKRQLGELQPSELVITILISNIATLPIENTDVPLLAGAVPILTLMCFEVILSYFTMKSVKLRMLVSGSPRIVIRNGKIDQAEMESLRYSMDDLMEQLRTNNVFQLQEVEMAVVETTGKLSIYKKTANQNPTMKDLHIKASPPYLPAIVVSDGQLVSLGLKYCKLTEHQMRQIIKKEGWELSDIFVMTCTPFGETYVVPKDKTPTDPKEGGSL